VTLVTMVSFVFQRPTTSKFPGPKSESPGGQQGSTVSFMEFMWFHAIVLTRTRYIDN